MDKQKFNDLSDILKFGFFVKQKLIDNGVSNSDSCRISGAFVVINNSIYKDIGRNIFDRNHEANMYQGLQLALKHKEDPERFLETIVEAFKESLVDRKQDLAVDILVKGMGWAMGQDEDKFFDIVKEETSNET